MVRTSQPGRGTGECQVRPLGPGLDSQMGAYFLEGDFHLPATQRPSENSLWAKSGGTRQNLGLPGIWPSPAEVPRATEW